MQTRVHPKSQKSEVYTGLNMDDSMAKFANTNHIGNHPPASTKINMVKLIDCIWYMDCTAWKNDILAAL